MAVNGLGKGESLLEGVNGVDLGHRIGHLKELIQSVVDVDFSSKSSSSRSTSHVHRLTTSSPCNFQPQPIYSLSQPTSSSCLTICSSSNMVPHTVQRPV
jgi:hypothetical protein